MGSLAGMVQLALFPSEAPLFVGDSELARQLAEVVERGFPHVAFGGLEVRVDWNRRLRSTVGRTIYGGDASTIELSPHYHDMHPGELVETLAHEFAHVLHPGAGHRRPWRDELEDALERLHLPLRPNLSCAAHDVPTSGRYLWRCPECGSIVARRARRRRDEVASFSTCCRAPVVIFDLKRDEPAPARPFQVGCRRCQSIFVAYDDLAGARRFARHHRCNCGGRLRTREPAR